MNEYNFGPPHYNSAPPPIGSQNNGPPPQYGGLNFNNFGPYPNLKQRPYTNEYNFGGPPWGVPNLNNAGSYGVPNLNYMNQNETFNSFTSPKPKINEYNFGSAPQYGIMNQEQANKSFSNKAQETIEKNQDPLTLTGFFQSFLKNPQNNNINNENTPKTNFTPKKEPQKNPIFKNDDLLKFSNSDYENLTVKQLKAILGRRGISKTGNKADLIEKIKLYLENYKWKGKNKNILDRLSQKCRPALESSDSDSSLSESDSDLTTEMENFLMYYYCPGLNISDSKLKKFSSKQMEVFTNEELKLFLEFRNISKVGNKGELIYKLQKYLQEKEEKKKKRGDYWAKIQKKKDKLMELSLDELKYLMMKNYLPVSGTKSDLVDRLLRKKKYI